MNPRVALVTCEQFPNLYDDDRLLQRALSESGVRAEPAVWSDSGVAWETFDLAVIRSTWDYHRRYAEFLRWLDGVSPRTRVWNPPEMIRWNAHKTYLRELRSNGVAIVPTEWIGTAEEAVRSLAAHGWSRAVVKPTVSANAERTSVVSDRDPFPALEDRGPEGWMLQPYLAEVEGAGERSLIFLDGVFSHAVQRKAALNPTAGLIDGARVIPTEGELHAARRALSAVAGSPLYGRADLITTRDGVVRVMELELVEPLLYLGTDRGAPVRLAQAIGDRLR